MATNRQNKLSQKAVIKQILKRCSSLGKKTETFLEKSLPIDVPKKHFVVYVGENRTRFILPISTLRFPQFINLLKQSEEEFGFNNETGIVIPCTEEAFLSLLEMLK